ncbi:MAG: type 2 lanthipeptide synthetase LanM family protein [bacterium]
MTEDKLKQILGIPTSAFMQFLKSQPQWVIKTQESFSSDVISSHLSILEKITPDNPYIFLKMVSPLINDGFLQLNEKLTSHIESHSKVDLPFYPDQVIEIMFPSLANALFNMIIKTVILELNVFRLRGRLNGATSEERFTSFIHQISNKDVAFLILKEYPVLCRQIINTINNWVNSSYEFLQRLFNDWHAILDIFSPDGHPGLLAKIYASGDPHFKGHSVLVTEFESGFKLVYKPRSMAIDIHFQELLMWINKCLKHKFFSTLKILDRQTYGWMEFIPYLSCETPDEVRRFYERIGGYLALFYALDGTDFHFENLIASKEYPVFVDLESLFQPHIGEKTSGKSEFIAANFVLHTVMRTGLLPQRVFIKADYKGLDLSGISPVEGQISPDRMFVIQRMGTDEARLVAVAQTTRKGYNQPSIQNSEVKVVDYINEIIKGFTTIYQFLLKCRKRLLSKDGPLSKFIGDEIRVLIRPTRSYALLLYNSYHPDFLRNALDRERFFDKLWVAIEDHPYLKKLIQSEKEDLENNNIPIFTTFTDSCNLYDSRGRKFPKLFANRVIDMVRKRINSLNLKDLDRQIYFIRASIATLELDKHKNQIEQLSLPKLKANHNYEKIKIKAMKVALDVAEKLDQFAMYGKRDICWIGLTFDNEGYLSVGPLSIDLYSGICGILLFLAYLDKISGNKKYTSISQSGLITLRRLIKRNKSWLNSLGAFSGWGGIIYTYSHLGALWRRPLLYKEAEGLALSVAHLIEKDKYFDIMAGVSGFILSLLSLYSCWPTAKILNLAIKCGEHLVTNARLLETGIGWTTTSQTPASGFGHGAAGIALALIKLFEVSKDKRFKKAAFDAIAYERSLFIPERQNWITWDTSEQSNDAKTNQPRAVFPVAWCHGAVGIGLSRLSMLNYINDNIIHTEIRSAIYSTFNYGFGYNHSLCHGDFGNFDFLLYASQFSKYKNLRKKVNNIAASILEGIDKYGFRFSNKFQVETCGLMIGLAGIGYECLRIVDPGHVPSVLTLSPPYSSES